MLAAVLFAFAGTASAGIAETRHNLGTGSSFNGTPNAGANNSTGTAEICVFCHTPHGASQGAPAPLWNKRLSVNGVPTGGSGTYTTYAQLRTPSLDGQVAQVGSVSAACLSCHDGTQAMDNIINAPGSGGYDANGGPNGTRGWTWAGATVTANGFMQNAGDRISMLGTDLSNDHPIGIQYCGGGIDSAGAGSCKDKDFKAVDSATINGNLVFWVDTGGAGKQRTDLPLYVADRRLAGESGATVTTVTGPLVECASCHDPHVSEGQAGPVAGVNSGATFLRISNANSAVCTSCHVK
jgi:hypothetical protein